MKSAREVALERNECVFCGAYMEAGEGEATDGLVCDECTDKNEWLDGVFND